MIPTVDQPTRLAANHNRQDRPPTAPDEADQRRFQLRIMAGTVKQDPPFGVVSGHRLRQVRSTLLPHHEPYWHHVFGLAPTQHNLHLGLDMGFRQPTHLQATPLAVQLCPVAPLRHHAVP